MYRLKLPFRDASVRELALRALAIAREGLRRRARHDRDGQDESGLLDVLDEIADSGLTPAERKLALFEGRWQRRIEPVFSEFAY